MGGGGAEGAVASAGAGPIVSPPADHAAIGTYLDLDLFGVLRVAAEP